MGPIPLCYRLISFILSIILIIGAVSSFLVVMPLVNSSNLTGLINLTYLQGAENDSLIVYTYLPLSRPYGAIKCIKMHINQKTDLDI
jgi:hypothetical protein